MGDCCHDRGIQQTPPKQIDIRSSGDTGDNTFVTCNTPNARMNVPLHQINSESHQAPGSRPVSGKCGQGYSHEIHCHTPASPCCRQNVNTPGNCAPATAVQDVHSIGTPAPGYTEVNYHRRQSSSEALNHQDVKCASRESQAPRSAHSYTSNVQADKELSVNTPHCSRGPTSNEPAAVHTPRECVPASQSGETQSQLERVVHTEDYFSKSQENPTSGEFVRCAEQQTSRDSGRSVEQQTSRGYEKSVGQQTSRGLESYAQGSKQDNSSLEPPQPTTTSQSHSSPNATEPTVLNHLTFKEKQLVLSAIGKASSNMACETMLKERDRTNSGSIGRRDFQLVMDKIGVLKNLSSRELEAVYGGFPGKSDTGFDYNKFICACREYKSKASKKMI